MTPRIKQSNSDTNLEWFTQALLAQQSNKSAEYDLSGKGSIFELIHPALIRVEHDFIHFPQTLEFRSESGGWNFIAYKDSDSAGLHSATPSYGGFPWEISRFLNENPESAVLHFGHLGSMYVSRTGLEVTVPHQTQLFHHALPIWLDYALSSELWGVQGKWTRFHTCLHTLFEKYGLLIDQDFPGFYPLKPSAQYLTKLGFKGSLNETNFNLTFPWDFPLSGLKSLEETIQRGP